MHIAPYSEILTVLLFNGTHMGVIALIAQLTIFVASTIALHARCVFFHTIWD